MSVFTLVAVLVGVAVAGLAYLGYRLWLRSSEAVPISDVSEIQKLKQEFFNRQKANQVTPRGGSANFHETAELKSQIMNLEDENAILHNRILKLEKEKTELEITNTKLKEAQQDLGNLKTENQQWQQQIAEQEQKCAELKANIDSITQELDAVRQNGPKVDPAIETELQNLKTERDQLLQERSVVQTVKDGYDQLQQDKERLASKYRRLLERFAVLRRRVNAEKDNQDDLLQKMADEKRVWEQRVFS